MILDSFQFDDMFDYFICISPLVVAHLSLPPLSFFSTNIRFELTDDQIYIISDLYNLIIPSIFLKKEFIASLMLDKEEHPIGDYHWFTHVFIHASYRHMFNNLYSTLLLGYPVYQKIGTIPLLTMYIFGGFASSLPIENMINNNVKFSTEVEIVEEKDTLSKVKQTLFNVITSKLAPIVSRSKHILHCGSSGAVYSLLGFNFIYAIKDSYFLCVEFIKHITSNNNNNDNFNNNSKRLSLLFYKYMFNIMSISNIIYREKILLHLQREKTEKFIDLFVSQTLIGHSAHIQGFLFGSSIAVLTIWRKMITSRKSLIV